MLSLKQGLGLNSMKMLGDFEPSNISSLSLWYKHLSRMENSAGETDPSGFSNGDKIKWQSQVGSNLLYNDQNWNRPVWSTNKKSVDIAGDKFYELTTSLVIPTDFSLCMNVQFKNVPSSDGLYGSGNTNMFEATDSETFTFRAGGTTELEFTSSPHLLSPDIWYSIILQRTSGVVSVYVDDGNNNILQWGSGTDSDTLTIETVGSWNGDNANLDGYIRDLSYFTTALTSTERQNMVAYLNNY